MTVVGTASMIGADAIKVEGSREGGDDDDDDGE